jgi:hypothetical protein
MPAATWFWVIVPPIVAVVGILLYYFRLGKEEGE